MKFLPNTILLFLSLIALYALMHVFLVFGEGCSLGSYLPYIREGVWGVVVLSAILLGRSQKLLTRFLGDRGRVVALLLLCAVWFFTNSISLGVPLQQMIVGFKYSLYPFFILLSAIFLGYHFTRSTGEVFFRNIIKLFFGIILCGLILQMIKLFSPNLLQRIGYGPVGDYLLGSAPPLYYRTGPGGTMRLQGLFSGPNNYGFFLIGVFSLLGSCFIQSKDSLCKTVKILETGLLKGLFLVVFLTSLVWTFSRGVYLGVFLQLILLVVFLGKISKKTILVACGSSVLLFFLVFFRKQGSTLEHISSRIEGVKLFLLQPQGYGLGSSGPSVHYNFGVSLPENYYLQLFLDGGFFGGILRLLFLGVFARNVMKLLKTGERVFSFRSDDFVYKAVFLLSLGLCGLLFTGMFLHVFEDSMVNYLFFVPYGIGVGLLGKEYSQN